MNILVVGSGGREHAIIRKLKENPRVGTVYCAPGNGGIAADAICVAVKADNIEGMVAFAVAHAIDFAIITPDDPLVLGMVDAMNAAGIKTFGPNKLAARIEGSKTFAKNLMRNHQIPTAEYQTFTNAADATAYLHEKNSYPVVIKADGLALGKGVVIAQNAGEAETAVRSMMEERVFGESGSQIVIEEFLTGPEVSVLSFCDGETVIPMVSSMDHKRAFDGDIGPNTGGMGTVAPNRCYTPEIAAECMEKIFRPTLAAMKAEGCPFSGCLYFGLMLTPNGPSVIEYNCRFGDPEAQVVLPLLKTDLLEIMLAAGEGKLDQMDVTFLNAHAACVVLASGGYPTQYQTGFPISGLNPDGQISDATIYHAGTRLEDGAYKTAGGRVMGVTCVAETPEKALEKAYHAAEKIHFEGVYFRHDIGAHNHETQSETIALEP